MGVITTGSNPKLLWPGINSLWGLKYDEHSMEYPELFDQETSTQAYEEDVQVTGFGMLSVKAQGAAVTYQEQEQGYIKRYTHVAYASGFIVTREEAADNLYLKVAGDRVAALAFSARQTKEVVTANVYNRAFNSSYTGADGKELLATDHPTVAGGAQQNEPTTAADLSEASLEDMITLISKCKDDKGFQIKVMPKALIVPPDLWFEAQRIMKSALNPDTANNAVNVVKSMIPGGVVMNHYLTDTDAWFVRTNVPNGMKLFTREKMEFTDDGDFDTMNRKYKCYERYSVGWTDWRGLFGSPGA